jgi:hypothetical protein
MDPLDSQHPKYAAFQGLNKSFQGMEAREPPYTDHFEILDTAFARSDTPRPTLPHTHNVPQNNAQECSKSLELVGLQSSHPPPHLINPLTPPISARPKNYVISHVSTSSDINNPPHHHHNFNNQRWRGGVENLKIGSGSTTTANMLSSPPQQLPPPIPPPIQPPTQPKLVPQDNHFTNSKSERPTSNWTNASTDSGATSSGEIRSLERRA